MKQQEKTNSTPAPNPAAPSPATGGTPLRIGELLVKEGLATEQDVQKALEIQKTESEIRKLPLGEILVKIGAMSQTDLESVLEHPNLRKNLGSMAVEKGLIAKQDLQQCLATKRADELVGQVLVREGILTNEDITHLLQSQINDPRFGEQAIKLRLISEADLKKALRIQKSARQIGQILCDMNVLDPLDLNRTLDKYNKQQELGEVLLTLGYITKEKLALARQAQKSSGESLKEILLKQKLVAEKDLLAAISRQYNIAIDDLKGFSYTEDAKRRLGSIIGQKYARKNALLPIMLKGNELSVAITNPENMSALHELRALYRRYSLSCLLVMPAKFTELFEQLYGASIKGDSAAPGDASATQELRDDLDFLSVSMDEELSVDDRNGATEYGARKDIEAEELVNFIIKYGIVNGASDIHLEQDRSGVHLRYRLDGVLRETDIGWLKQKLREKATAVVSRIKVMSKLDIAEKRLPQDGVFRLNYFDPDKSEKIDLDFRVATCRAIGGENIVIRILDSRKANVGLDNLGHSPHILDSLKTLLKSSAGMILVSGPTGSGKSSTLYGALRYIYNPSTKIITAEDPVEYNFPGIMQTQVHTKIDLTFTRLLRSFLRCDPDVILVGEMRDVDTAKIGFDAAQTGHLLLSTIHTNDAISAISRLTDLNVDVGQIASCLQGVVAQRLIRRICPSCTTEYIPGEEEWGAMFKAYPSHLSFFRGEGCEACNFSGFKGRTILSEIFVMDAEIALALSQGSKEGQIRKMAVESGMKTMLDDGISKLNLTTISELIRTVPYDTIKEFRSRSQAQEMADSLIESLLQGNSPKKVEKDETPESFILSDPDNERPKLDLMAGKYEKLRAQSGQPNAGPLDASLFKEFISTSFQNICRQYGCSTVRFNMEKANGKVQLLAFPQNMPGFN